MDFSRKLAYLVIKDVEAAGSYSNLALNTRLSRTPVESPALVRELVHGVLRNRSLLDWQIDSYLSNPAINVRLRIILRMGFYQLLFMSDKMPAHAAVNETVELANRYIKGFAGLVNAILRNYLRDGRPVRLPSEDDEELYLSVKYSCSPQIVSLWLESYGRQVTEDMLKVGLTEPPLGIRPNTLIEDNPYLQPQFVEDLKGAPIDADAYEAGLFSVQDESARSIVEVFLPLPGQRILDCCAAPGGKACAMAQLMENRGEIDACDIHESRLRLIDKEAERLGIRIIRTHLRDASEDSSQAEFSDYDGVLCDVPCSGLGTIRRKPEIKYNFRQEEVDKLTELQLAILKNSAKSLKPGGRLMYSTCTVNPAENEAVAEAFLRDATDFELLEHRQIFPQEGGSDGAFYCLMRKKDL